MKKLIDSKILFILFRLILGFVFIYAGIEKILDPAGLARDVANYRILPDVLVNLWAIALPWIELLVGLGLLLGFYRRGSSLVLFGLLLMFTVAITVNLVRGVDINCGCKTPWAASDRISLQKLVEEFIFLFMTAQTLLHQSKVWCLDALRGGK